MEGPLYDAGELVFEPLKPELQPSLTSIVVTRDTQFEQEIKARLIIEHRDFLGQDGGTWQARYRPIVEEKRLRHGERVTFNGLGLNPYRLELWSEGYVVEVIDVRPDQAEAIDLDAQVITPAKTFRFRYIGNFNVTDEDNWPAFKTEAIMANGKRQFVFHEERHPKGYLQRSRMRLTPNGQEVEILYPVIPTEYYDLGAVDIADIRTEDLLPEALDAKKISRPIFLQSGRTYFMQNIRREVNALFEVKEIMEGSQQKPL